MVHPHLMRRLNANVVPRSQDLRDLHIPDDNVRDIEHAQPDSSKDSIVPKDGRVRPDEDDRSPVILPEMMTVFLASPATAEVRASRVVTVVVRPPAPPVVPPLRAAKPRVATSLTEALLVELGEADTTWTVRKATAEMNHFIVDVSNE